MSGPNPCVVVIRYGGTEYHVAMEWRSVVDVRVGDHSLNLYPLEVQRRALAMVGAR